MNEQQLDTLSNQVALLTQGIKISFGEFKEAKQDIKRLTDTKFQLEEIHKITRSETSKYAVDSFINTIKELPKNVLHVSANTVKRAVWLGAIGVGGIAKVGGFVGGHLVGEAVDDAIGIKLISGFTAQLVAAPLDSISDACFNTAKSVKIISKEKKISEKEAFNQLLRVFEKTIKTLIVQCDYFIEFAEIQSDNSDFYKDIKKVKYLPNIDQTLNDLSKTAKIKFSLLDTKTMKQEVKQIKSVLLELLKIAKVLKTVIDIYEQNSKYPLDCDTVLILLPNLDKNITGIGISLNQELIVYYATKQKILTTLTSHYKKLLATTEDLIQKTESRKDYAEIWFKVKPALTYSFGVAVLGVLGLKGWTIGVNFLTAKDNKLDTQVEQVLGSSLIGLQRLALSSLEDELFSNNVKSSENLAMNAATAVQNSPHPIEVWQQAQADWQEAIELLEVIPESSSIYTQSQDKLNSYRTNHLAITQRISTERKAVENFEAARKLAWEAAVNVQNPPHPVEVWQKAQSNLQQAISLLENVPKGTYVEAEAKEKLASYQANYKVVSDQITQIKAQE